MNLDAFKCFSCNKHFSGLELGGTTYYPYRNFTEYYCKACKGPAPTPAPKLRKRFVFRSGIRVIRIHASTLEAAKLALAAEIPDAWTDTTWKWKVNEESYI